MSQIYNLKPKELEKWLASGEAVLLDVREPGEHAHAAIDQAVLCPLSQVNMDLEHLPTTSSKKLVVHCQSGRRSMMAAKALMDAGWAGDIWNLEGGIAAWKSMGLPVVAKKKPCRIFLPLDRQVQLIISGLILSGLTLQALGWPYGIVLTWVAGLGLLNAAVSGWCGMVKVLAKMPWNQS